MYCIVNFGDVELVGSMHSKKETKFKNGISIYQEAVPTEMHENYNQIFTKAAENTWLNNATKNLFTESGMSSTFLW